ncbi:MAG: hypothetical protein RLZ14_460 [Actinomycetota bacterium]|jgi:hypothetical protein
MLLNEASSLPPGIYLLGAQPSAATKSFAALKTDLTTLISRIPS